MEVGGGRALHCLESSVVDSFWYLSNPKVLLELTIAIFRLLLLDCTQNKINFLSQIHL